MDKSQNQIMNNNNGRRKKKNQPNQLINFIAGSLILSQTFLGGNHVLAQQEKESDYTYSDLLQGIETGKVEKVIIDPATNSAKVYLVGGDEDQPEKVALFYQNTELIRKIRQKGVDFVVDSSAQDTAAIINGIQIGILLILIFGLFLLIKRSANSAAGAMNFGKSRAKFQMEATTGIGFNDVAGIEEAKEELQEVVVFLKSPEKFTVVGARIPRGVLLVGPPGTGKTLLAKAIAGEAEVPFFSISGSEFVEMFVGVGASRVRDLFRKAKENAPCLVFIDEIDAVGRQRGAGIGGGNDEREQTLNQLLTEMDGFEGNTGIIIIAATNRPDVLDSALLRPGRFDRQVFVDYPDLQGRSEILTVHAQNKKIASDVSLQAIAQRTIGFSGAELANLLNEAAILTVRRRKDEIGNLEINDAYEKVKMGLEGRALTDGKQKTMTAYHEIGHAVVSYFVPENDPIEKVTIIPRGTSMGSTWYLPTEEQGLETRSKLLAIICRALGGRAAEEVVFGYEEIDSGATSDIKQLSAIARAMVKEWGMSALGQVKFEDEEYSEDLAYKIDLEVSKIIFSCYEKAKQIIHDNRPLIDYLVDVLIEKETIDGDTFREIVATYTQKSPVLTKTEVNLSV
jgi:cell division protease FtsH